MKIREKAVKILVEHGMFENQAIEIIERYLASPLGEPMLGRIDDDEKDCHPTLFVPVWIAIKQVALEWIDEKKPKHWARHLFLN
jgi:hypothetical protein